MEITPSTGSLLDGNQQTGANAVDNGTIATLEANFIAALRYAGVAVGTDTGAANACVVNYTPAVPTLVDGMVLWFKAAANNTGNTTLNVNGLGVLTIVGGGNNALQGGEIVANGKCMVVYSATFAVWILIECTGAALQVGAATKSMHAPQMAQVTGVVGSVRNLKMSLSAAAASGTMTADEIIVETALGGVRYCLSNFNKTINLATSGAGGLDTGSSPGNGFVGIYAIYNPTTGASALLATNATAVAMPSIYGGANMPSGYTASALVSVWPTNGSGQFIIGHQVDRSVSLVYALALSASSTQTPSPTSLSIASLIPLSARTARGNWSNASTVATSIAASVHGSSGQIGTQQIAITGATSSWGNWEVPIITAQTIWYSGTTASGTMSLSIWVNGYTF